MRKTQNTKRQIVVKSYQQIKSHNKYNNDKTHSETKTDETTDRQRHTPRICR